MVMGKGIDLNRSDNGYYLRSISTRQTIATARQFGLKLKQKNTTEIIHISKKKLGFNLTYNFDLCDFL